jgi:hypothetical protein
MKLSALFVLAAICGIIVPAHACRQVTPAVRSWVQCAYQAASKTNDHKFMVNYAHAKWLDEELLSSAPGRWKKLQPRLIDACGAFSSAASKDRKNLKKIERTMAGSHYVPDDVFAAIADTSDIDKLVKN